jgi:hypothetical protein
MRSTHFSKLAPLVVTTFLVAAGCVEADQEESVAGTSSAICTSPNAVGVARLCAPPGGGGGGPPPPSLPPVPPAPSVYQWTSDAKVSNNEAWRAEGASIAQLNGKLYLVHGTGDSPLNPFEQRDAVVWLSTFDGNSWTNDNKIYGPRPSPHSLGTATIAAFSGRLYMFVVLEDNAVWWSRMNNETTGWSPMVQTPYRSAFPPAAAAGTSKVEIVGSDPATGQLWEASMDIAEAFSASTLLPGQYTTAPSAPSLVSHVPRSGAQGFYMAYTRVVGGAPTIVIGYRPYSGGAWTSSVVAAASTQSPYQPALGSHAGILHLVHAHDAAGDQVSWNYLDGPTWSGEANVPGQKMFGAPALSSFHPVGQAPRLVLVHPSSHDEQIAYPNGPGNPVFKNNPLWYSTFQ